MSKKLSLFLIIVSIALPINFAAAADQSPDDQQDFEAIKAKRLDNIELRIDSLSRQKICIESAQGMADFDQCNKERKQEIAQKKLSKIESQKQSLEKRQQKLEQREQKLRNRLE